MELGTESKFTFVTRDLKGQKYYNEDDHVTVKIQTTSGNFVKKKIEDSVDGNYTVSFTPDTVGPHSVTIALNGQPLTGSPWSVQVSPHQYKHVFTFGSRGTESGQFNLPHSIAVDERNNHIAVADSGNNRIQIFDTDGLYLREFGQKVIKAGRLSQPRSQGLSRRKQEEAEGRETLGTRLRLSDPRSVAFTNNGDLIVFHSGKISLFNDSGQFIKHITNKDLKVIMYVSVARDGRMIVCDWGDKTVKVLSPDGTEMLTSFSAPNCKDSLYSAIYHQDMFFVSYRRACLKVFNKEGVFLYDIGSEGSGDGQLSCPRRIAIDKFNNLIVCDSDNSRLQVFTLDGTFVSTINGQLAELGRPYSVAVSNKGQVFVTDENANCIHVFQ